MTILGNIANRLKTDIAENTRAQIDVSFSRQLTEDKFNRAAEDRKAQREQEVRERQRTEMLADQEKARSRAIHAKTIEVAFENGRQTGDYGALLKLSRDPNLDPELRGYAKSVAEMRLGKSMEAIESDHKIWKETQQLTNDGLRVAITQGQANETKRANIAREEIQKRKVKLDEIASQLEINRSNMDKEGALAGLAAMEGILSQSQMESAEAAIFEMGSGKAAHDFVKGLVDTQLAKNREEGANTRHANTIAAQQTELEQKMAFRRLEFDYKKGMDVLKENQGVADRRMLINSLEGMTTILNDEEIEAAVTAMEGAGTAEQARDIYKIYMDRSGAKLRAAEANARAEAAARADRNLVPSSVTAPDIAAAKVFGNKYFEDTVGEDAPDSAAKEAFNPKWDFALFGRNAKESEALKETVFTFVAQEAKNRGREGSRGDAQKHYKKIFDVLFAHPELIDEDGGFDGIAARNFVEAEYGATSKITRIPAD